MGHCSLRCLAFADDIAIMAETSDEVQDMLYILEDGLNKCGLKVSSQKCAAFRIVSLRKTWAINDPELYYGRSSIPFVQPDDKLVYLGINIHP